MSDLDICNRSLLARDDDDPSLTITKKSKFDDFLEQVERSGEAATLIINLDNLPSSFMVRGNNIWDINAKINQRDLPPNLKIITVRTPFSSEELSAYPAFISRQDIKIDYCGELPTIDDSPAASQEIVKIDLKGRDNWQELLFGAVQIINNHILWRKELACFDQTTPKTYHLLNLPEEIRKIVANQLALAKQLGFISYLGQRLPIPASSHFVIEQNAFDFSLFNDHYRIYPKTLLSQAPADCYQINEDLFDHLLAQKKIENGQYSQLPGLLEEYRDGRLNLYLGNLSEAKLYLLFATAKEYNVQLHLYTPYPAETLRISGTNQAEPEPSEPSGRVATAQVVITSNAYASYLNRYKPLDDDHYLLRIDDSNSLTLFHGMPQIASFNPETGRFNNDFALSPGLLPNLLEQGKKIILAGHFSEPFLREMAPLFRHPNLVLLIEDDKVATYQINWLEEAEIIRDLEPELPPLAASPADQPTTLAEAATRQAVIHLTGPNSQTIDQALDDLVENPDFILHYQPDSWLKSAKDNPHQRHCLVIDNANYLPLELTDYAGLLDDNPQARVIALPDQVAEIPRNCGLIVTNAGSNSTIRQARLLSDPRTYQLTIDSAAPAIAPARGQDSQVTCQALKSGNYLSLPETANIEANLAAIFASWQTNQAGWFYLEGEIGLGKSELIKAFLAANHVNNITSLEASDNGEGWQYYKLTGEASLAEIREVLKQAQENPRLILWCDEFNSCFSDREIVVSLARALAGKDPSTGQPIDRPVKLLATGNPAAYSERLPIDDLLKTHLREFTMPGYHEYRRDSLKEVINHYKEGLSPAELEETLREVQANPQIDSFRSLRQFLNRKVQPLEPPQLFK